MKRELKFRAWLKDTNVMVSWDEVSFNYNQMLCSIHDYIADDTCVVMQFTGLRDKSGKEIYEGDVFRVEEDGVEDGTDQIYYLVVVWVTEWAMFCTLRVADEYFNYLYGGVKALDEPMFWTYTLEDTNDRRFYLCGNIYQNHELLKQ